MRIGMVLALGALLAVTACTSGPGSSTGSTADFQQDATGPQTTVLGTTAVWPVCEVERGHDPKCDAQPLPNVTVVAFAASDLDHPIAQATSDKGAAFVLKLTKGRYTVQLEDPSNWMGAGPDDVVVDGHGTAHVSVTVTDVGG